MTATPTSPPNTAPPVPTGSGSNPAETGTATQRSTSPPSPPAGSPTTPPTSDELPISPTRPPIGSRRKPPYDLSAGDIVTRIRYDDIPRIAHTGMRAGHHLEQYGQSIWLLTRDWQTPLAATALEPGRGTTTSDPTGTAAITSDELRHAHTQILAAIDTYEMAAVELYSLLERYRPLSDIERRQAGARISQVRDCVICDEPALPRPRRGMCERCYRRWGRYPGSTFDARNQYEREQPEDGTRQLGTA